MTAAFVGLSAPGQGQDGSRWVRLTKYEFHKKCGINGIFLFTTFITKKIVVFVVFCLFVLGLFVFLSFFFFFFF